MNEKDMLRETVRVAKAVGKYLLETQESVSRLDSMKDFVTSADIGSENIILPELAQIDPSAELYSEESFGANPQKELWVVDPLDGTVNFFHRDDLWGISIARVSGGMTRFGAVYLPKRGILLAVRRNIAPLKGFWWIERPPNTNVSMIDNLASAQIYTDWCGYDKPKTLSVLAALNEATLYPQIRLCATNALLMVATGKTEGYVHPGPTPFDIAAACLIVEACGGRVTDMEGKPWTAFSKSIVATNGRIHDGVLKLFQ
jgi:myo-inositol-1(or 4)-monophosphatase